VAPVFTRESTRGEEAAPEAPSKPPPLKSHLVTALLVLVVAAILGVFYLGLYSAKNYTLPIGWDTPRYLFHASFVAERGFSGLPANLPPPSKILQGRPGFAIFVLSLSKLFASSSFAVAAVVPVVGMIAMALAAGAFLSFALRRGPLDMAVVAVVVGLSAVAVRLMAPETYTDNILAAALFLTAMVPIVAVVRGERGMLSAILLLGLGGILHPPTYSQVLVVIAVVGLVYLPSSWIRWRRGGERPWATLTGRLASIAVGAGAVTAAGIYGVLRATPDTPSLTRDELDKKLREDLPLYRFPLTVPLAGLGVAELVHEGFGPGARDRLTARFVLVVLLAWGLVLGIGVVAFETGWNVPAHRLLAFLLPLPMLLALGVLALGRVLRDALAPRTWARVAGVAVVAIVVAVVGFLGYRDYYDRLPRDRGVEWLQQAKVENGILAGAYLDRAHVPDSAPVVFVIDDRGPNPLSYVPEMAYILRSVLRPERIEHAYFYVGDADRYLAGRPTHRDAPPTYDANVARFWPTIQRLLPSHPVALLLHYYNGAYAAFAAAHPGSMVAPDLAVLHGPRLSGPFTPPADPYRFRSRPQIALLGIGAFMVILLIGAGWAVALVPSGVRSFEAIALAPAFGIAALTAGALVADRVGIRLRGPGALVPIVAVALGGAFVGIRRLRREEPDVLSSR
jgi:hypothetical protein